MSSSTTIGAVEIARLDIPLHTPFGISGGAQAIANNVLVTVELADGTRGYGEAAPLPPYNGETQAEAIEVLRAAETWLVGLEARDWRGIAAEFRTRQVKRSGSAQCALETALVDALARRAQVPLWRFFSSRMPVAGEVDGALETDMTVTTGSVEEAATATRDIRGRGIRIIKVKIGGTEGVALDLARLAAIHEIAPDSPLVIDGNAGLSRASAGELIRGLKARGIVPALLEQWLAKDDLAGMRALREESGWPVAADEAASTADDVHRIAEAHAAEFVNIKLMKAGLSAALDVAAAAHQHKLGLMIGGNVESVLAMTVSACFAVSVGGFKYADLDTPFFLAANPFTGGYAFDGGRILLGQIAAGHGVVPRG